MKTKIWKMMLVALIVLPATLTSCHDEFFPGVTGQGEIVEETLMLDDFTGFVSTIAAEIYLTQGDKQEVVIEAQQNIIDNIETSWIENGVWNIGFRHPVHYAKPVKVYITIPTLTKAGISGSGKIFGMTPFTGLDRLKVFVTGSGDIELETYSEELDAVITGSGDLTMSGETVSMDLTLSGSGGFFGRDLVTTEAGMTITGSGNVRLTVQEYLKVLVTGSGNVYYSGNPEVDLRVTGSGNVIHQ
jgi:hypothetical protein